MTAPVTPTRRLDSDTMPLNASRANATMIRIRLLPLVAVTASVSMLAPALGAGIESSLRERISLNADWRFTQGDPQGSSAGLLYDVRPKVLAPELLELTDRMGFL